MRLNPLGQFLFYMAFGAVFLYFAIKSVKTTLWNFETLLLIAFASLDFFIGLRLFGRWFVSAMRDND